MNNTYQYNKVNCITPDRVVKKTDSKTLVKGYSTLIPIKYNNSDLRNKGSHKTKKSHKKTLILPTIWRKWLKKRKKVLMENLHKPSMINPINNPQITTHAHWSRISSTNISLCLFFFFFFAFYFFILLLLLLSLLLLLLLLLLLFSFFGDECTYSGHQ